jgi:hypothetical protein
MIWARGCLIHGPEQELAALDLVAQGLPNRQIGAGMFWRRRP